MREALKQKGPGLLSLSKSVSSLQGKWRYNTRAVELFWWYNHPRTKQTNKTIKIITITITITITIIH